MEALNRAYEHAHGQVEHLQQRVDELQAQRENHPEGSEERSDATASLRIAELQLQQAKDELQKLEGQLDAAIDGQPRSRFADAPHFTAEDMRQGNEGRTSGELYSDREDKKAA